VKSRDNASYPTPSAREASARRTHAVKSSDPINVCVTGLAAGMHLIMWEKIMAVQIAQQVSVRRMNAEDQELLEQMYSHAPLGGTLGLPPPDPILRECWLEHLRLRINLVACIDGKMAGHLALLPTGGAAEMIAYVHQDFRRKGVATALMKAAIEEAHAAGFSYIWLLVAKTNFAAQHFLRKRRFRIAWQDLHEMQFMHPTGGS
jgi:ribosomal protein S18 acetylase RimI-like enzyme